MSYAMYQADGFAIITPAPDRLALFDPPPNGIEVLGNHDLHWFLDVSWFYFPMAHMVWGNYGPS